MFHRLFIHLLVTVGLICSIIVPKGYADTQAPASPPDQEIAASPAPIMFWNREITVLRATFNDLSPTDRAKTAMENIQRLAPRPDWELSTAEVSKEGITGILLYTRGQSLFVLVPGDEDSGSGETLMEKAQTAANQLKSVLDQRAAQNRWSILLKGIGLSTAATVIFITCLLLILRLRQTVMTRLDRMIVESRGKLNVAGVNLVPILLGIERALVKLSLFAMVLVAIDIWITFCLNRFYYTQPWADQMVNFIVGIIKDFALSTISAIPGIVTVVIIFWFTRVFTGAVTRFFIGVEKDYIKVPWLHADSARASRRLVVVAIWMFALTVAYPYIPGSGSEAFKGISVFAGLMLSLGSSGFVNHIMSGLVIAYSGALRPGEYVTVGSIEGTVEEMGPISTKIVTPKKEWINIPNGVMVSGSITNYSRLATKEGAMVSTSITIGYDTPWRQVHALLLQAAKNTPEIRTTPQPFVLQRSLSDFYVAYELRFYIDRAETRNKALSNLHANIQDAFNEAEVQIMSPNFVAQPEKQVVVPKSAWFLPPALQPKGETPPELNSK